LVKMPFFEIPVYAEKTIFDLLVSGVTPIWAHPERCTEVIDNFNAVRAYTDNGVKLQINSGSLAGVYGRKVKRAAIRLIDNGLAHIMASDTHRVGGDEILMKGFLMLEEICGRENALEMCFSAPSKTIELNKDHIKGGERYDKEK